MRFLRHLWRMLLGLLRGLVWITGLATLTAIALFLIADQPLPHQALVKILERLSAGGEQSLDANSAAIGLRGGLVLRQVRLLPKHLASPPWATADEIRLSGGIHPSRAPGEWVETLLAHKVKVRELPAELPAFLGASAAGASFPSNTAPIRFDLVDISFMDFHFKRLQGVLRVADNVVLLDNLRIEWPPSGPWPDEVVTGNLRIDPAKEHVEGLLAGHTVPEKLYPLFQLLEAHGVERICRSFTFPSAPVEVEARIYIAPETPRYELRLNLAIRDATYNDVPVRRASSIIVAEGSNDFDRVVIRPLDAEREEGTLSGGLVYDCISNNLEVLARSDIAIEPLLRIVTLTNAIPQVRESLVFDKPPRLTAAGVVAFPSSHDTSAIVGTLAADGCAVQGVRINALQADYDIATNVYQLRNVRATLADGLVQGDIIFQCPPNSTTIAYRTALRIRDLDMGRLCASFGVTNPPPGRLNGKVELQSEFNAPPPRPINGQGELKLTNSVIARIPLFAGFTDYLARNVPGVNMLVAESEFTLPFTISNSVLRSNSALIEGSTFSLAGKGAYRIPEDQLDFNVRANIFRQRTWMGKITRVVTFPFSLLLLEFHVYGPVNHPTWDYHGIIDRIVDTVSGAAVPSGSSANGNHHGGGVTP